MTTKVYPKVCKQCGLAFDSEAKNTQFCRTCGQVRFKAAVRLAAQRRYQRDFKARRVPCVCGRRMINVHADYDRCSECRRELAALRRRPVAIPRAIGERQRLPDAPPRDRR